MSNEQREWVGQREFARRVGVNLKAVQKAIESGRLKLHDVGERYPKLDYLEAKADWESSRSGGNNNRFGELEADQAFEEEGENERWGVRKTKAEALLTEEKIAKAKLERAELEGLLHRAEDVENVLADVFLKFRSRILALPSKLAAQIADLTGYSDTAQVQSLLSESCEEALSELAHYDPRQIADERKRRVRGKNPR